MKGYVVYAKQNSIFKVKVIVTGLRPNKVQILPFRTITVLCKIFFQIVREKYLDYWIYTLKLSYINYSSRIQPTDKPWMSLQQSHVITATHQNFSWALLKYTTVNCLNVYMPIISYTLYIRVKFFFCNNLMMPTEGK